MEKSLEEFINRLYCSADGDGGDGGGGSDSGDNVVNDGDNVDNDDGGNRGILGGDGGDDKPKAGDFPEDWRDRMTTGIDYTGLSEEDKTEAMDKHKATLQRYNSPADLYKAHNELRTKMSAKQEEGYKPPELGENPSDEEVAEYRKATGVPEDHAGYAPEGVSFSEEDSSLIEDFTKSAHAANIPKAGIEHALKWYGSFAERQQEAMNEHDAEVREDTEEALREEWGSDYKRNVNHTNAWISTTFGEEAQDVLANARLPDGTKLLNHPSMIRDISSKARLDNPTSVMIDGKIPQDSAALGDRKAEIEKMMRTDRKAYDKDQKIQKEYLDILATEQNLANRK